MIFAGLGRACSDHQRAQTTSVRLSDPRNFRAQRSGLTLLELMVVLVILAIVATVALQSLQPQVENQRLSSAVRLLDEIKAATIGPKQKYQLDGTPLISGFVSDVGRLPRAESLDGEAEQPEVLGELWNTDSNLALNFPFQFRSGPTQPVDYSQIRLPCGWRGPYLQLPVGMQELKDPWGRAPETLPDSSGFCNQVCVPAILTGDEDEKLFIADLTKGKVDVTGKVLVDNPDSASIRIALLRPNPESSLTLLAAMDDEDEQSDSFLFRDVPVGFRAIVADANGQRQTRYVQVTHNGVNVFFDFRQQKTAPIQ